MDMQQHSFDPLNPYHSGYGPQARQLAKTQSGLWVAFKWAWKLLIYSPLLFTGYWIASKVLDKQSHGLLWIGVTLVVAVVLYHILMAVKSLLIVQRNRGNLMWIPLFTVCVAFTCLLPVYLAYDSVNYLVQKLNGSDILTWIVLACFAMYIYFQYDFLNDSHQKRV
jgi:hypothetical protein